MLQNQRKTWTCKEHSRREISFQARRIKRELQRKFRRWTKLAQKKRLNFVQEKDH